MTNSSRDVRRPGDDRGFAEPDRPLVVVCSGNRLLADKHDAEVHLARRLTTHANVLFVDPPVSAAGARRHPEIRRSLTRPRLRLIDPAIAHLVPLVAPKPFTRLTEPLTSAIVERIVRRAVDRLHATSVAIVTTWSFCDVTGAVPGARHVYWRTDDPVAAADLWGLDPKLLRRGDHRMLHRCDVVATVDPMAAERFRSVGVVAHFLPNGCDTVTIGRTDSVEPASGIDLDPPIAGFVGLLNDRTDLALLEAVADAGISLLIVGPHRTGFADDRIAALDARSNVRLVGPVRFDDLPAYLTHVDVGLVPYVDSAFNRASFPLKALEYLAAGRPVVATDLPALRWLADDLANSTGPGAEPSADVCIAEDVGGFVAAVRALSGLGEDDVHGERRRRFAASHDWAARAALVAEWCGILSETTSQHDGAADRPGAALGGRPR